MREEKEYMNSAYKEDPATAALIEDDDEEDDDEEDGDLPF